MHLTRSSALVALLLTCGLAQAEVRVEGPVEYGVFEGPQAELQSGERVLRRGNEQIRQTESVPAKLGTKFGMRYQLAGKVADDQPLTLLYFTPGIRTPDGVRHDKFEVIQKLVPGAPRMSWPTNSPKATKWCRGSGGSWCSRVIGCWRSGGLSCAD